MQVFILYQRYYSPHKQIYWLERIVTVEDQLVKLVNMILNTYNTRINDDNLHEIEVMRIILSFT